jgi:hypothetical protein
MQGKCSERIDCKTQRAKEGKISKPIGSGTSTESSISGFSADFLNLINPYWLIRYISLSRRMESWMQGPSVNPGTVGAHGVVICRRHTVNFMIEMP